MTPLRLARVVSRDFDIGRPYLPVWTRYFADLATQHGLPQRENHFAGLVRTTFTEMAEVVLDALAPVTEPFDLVVLAHSTPDSEAGWPAAFLARGLPGRPLAFAVADQGVMAPFTALRIAAEYAPQRALIVILDQSVTVPVPVPPPGMVVPNRDCVVALVLERRGTLGELTTRHHTGIAPADVRGILMAEAGDACVVTLGEQLARVDDLTVDTGFVPAPEGLPCTGVWTGLTTSLRKARRVVLADYDPALRHFAMCSVEVDGGSAR